MPRSTKYSGILFSAVMSVSLAGAGTLAHAEPSRDLLTDVQNEAVLIANTRQLIYEGARSGEGYFSPDGNALIFQSEREPGNPFYQIYVLDLQTGDTHRVSPGIGKTTCGFFVPGTNDVIFGSTHHDPQAKAKQKEELEFRASGKERRYSWDYDDAMDIFIASADGTNVRQLTDAPGYDAEGSVSPDGTQIVFSSLRGAFPLEKLSADQRKLFDADPASFGDLYIMNIDGSNVRQLTNSPGYDGGPFFSPDGKRIIWRHFDKTGVVANVFTMNTDGSDVRQLTNFESMSWAPFYHPSGEYVIFTSNKHGFANFELFLVDADGTREPVRVTTTAGFDGLPVFSPDGTRLSWAAGRTDNGKSQIFLADWNHTEAQRLLREAPERDRSNDAGLTKPIAADAIEQQLRGDVEYLASEELQGRMTGSAGAQLAADYLAAELAKAGLAPGGADGTYFTTFDFSAGVNLIADENQLTLTLPEGEPIEAELDVGFRPLAFTENTTIEGEVVFAGYGLTHPGEGHAGYNSYAGLDVKDKVVLVMRYVPEAVDPARRQ